MCVCVDGLGMLLERAATRIALDIRKGEQSNVCLVFFCVCVAAAQTCLDLHLELLLCTREWFLHYFLDVTTYITILNIQPIEMRRSSSVKMTSNI